MPQMKSYASSLLLAVTLAGLSVLGGCTTNERVYDESHSDYHTWDDSEARAYHSWQVERHADNRDYKQLKPDEQHDYWNWRHQHPG